MSSIEFKLDLVYKKKKKRYIIKIQTQIELNLCYLMNELRYKVVCSLLVINLNYSNMDVIYLYPSLRYNPFLNLNGGVII